MQRKILFLFIILLLLTLVISSCKRHHNTINFQIDLQIGNKEGDENYIFSNIKDIAVDENDNIYVSDSDNYRIQVFNESGMFINTIGNKGEGPGEFSTYPRYIEVDSTDNLYVYLGRKIIIFDKNGNYKRNFKIDFNINDFKVNDKNEIIILGMNDDKIFHIFNQKGQLIESFGEPIKIPTNYNKPKFPKSLLSIPICFYVYENEIYYIDPFKYKIYILRNKIISETIKRNNKIYKPPEAIERRGYYSFIFTAYSIFKIKEFLLINIHNQRYQGTIDIFKNQKHLYSQTLDAWLIEGDKKNRIYAISDADSPKVIRYKVILLKSSDSKN